MLFNSLIILAITAYDDDDDDDATLKRFTSPRLLIYWTDVCSCQTPVYLTCRLVWVIWSTLTFVDVNRSLSLSQFINASTTCYITSLYNILITQLILIIFDTKCWVNYSYIRCANWKLTLQYITIFITIMSIMRIISQPCLHCVHFIIGMFCICHSLL